MSENQRVRRERLVLEEFKAKIDLLQMRAKYNEDKYQFIDNKVKTFLINKMSVSTSNILTRMWNDECFYEEQRSIQRLKKSEIWLLKYDTVQTCTRRQKSFHESRRCPIKELKQPRIKKLPGYDRFHSKL